MVLLLTRMLPTISVWDFPICLLALDYPLPGFCQQPVFKRLLLQAGGVMPLSQQQQPIRQSHSPGISLTARKR